MSVDSVRQVEILDPSETSEDSTDILEISEEEGNISEVLVENYPFEGQEVIYGQFHYEKERWGKSEAEGTYQIRTGSGLIAVRQNTGPVDIDKIYDALDEALDGKAAIHKDLLPSQEGLWEFIDESDSIIELSVLMPYGETKTLSEIREEDNMEYEDVLGDYPLHSAILAFELPDGGSTEVRYKGNTLSISSESDEAYEFVLQRLERDAIGAI